MLGTHVTLEIAARCSTIPTPNHLTAVGTLSRVGTHVTLECAAPRSTIPTPNHLTAVGTHTRVGMHVTLEVTVRYSTKPTPNHPTLEGALSRVGTHVNPESAALPSPILTQPAGKGTPGVRAGHSLFHPRVCAQRGMTPPPLANHISKHPRQAHGGVLLDTGDQATAPKQVSRLALPKVAGGSLVPSRQTPQAVRTAAAGTAACGTTKTGRLGGGLLLL